jgi:hypothetical protein
LPSSAAVTLFVPQSVSINGNFSLKTEKTVLQEHGLITKRTTAVKRPYDASRVSLTNSSILPKPEYILLDILKYNTL